MDNVATRIKQIFRLDKFAELCGAEIVDVDQSRALVRAEIKPCHLNANGVVQGGMLFTLADFTYAVHANYIHPLTVTQCGHISCLAPANTSSITCEATEVSLHGRNAVGQVTVRDEKGVIVAVCSFNGFVKPLSKEEYLAAYQNKLAEEEK